MLAGRQPPPNGVWIDTLDLACGERAAAAAATAAGSDRTAPPLTFSLGGTTYAHAVPLASDGDLTLDLGGNATRFIGDGRCRRQRGRAGTEGSVDLRRLGGRAGRRSTARSCTAARRPSPCRSISTSAHQRRARVERRNDGTGDDTADWGGAVVIMRPGAQAPVPVAPSAPTPSIASGRTAEPHDRTIRASPARPPDARSSSAFPRRATGRSVSPPGTCRPASRWTRTTGIISGSLQQRRQHGGSSRRRERGGQDEQRRHHHRRRHRRSSRSRRRSAGIPGTSWARSVDAAKSGAAADGMVSSGLAAEGYTYVNIDDAWEGDGTRGRTDTTTGRPGATPSARS